MPKLVSDKAYLPFTKGLITEVSPLAYPEGATLDEDNIIITRAGERERRLGLKVDQDGEWVKPVSNYEACTVKASVCVPIGIGVKYHWPFNGNLNEVCYSLSYTPVGATSYTTAKFNSGASFSGNYFYLDSPIDFTVDEDWTIAFWIKTTNTSIIVNGIIYGGDRSITGMYVTGGTGPGFIVSMDNRYTGDGIIISSPITPDTWNYIHLVNKKKVLGGTNGSLSLYINGTLADTTSDSHRISIYSIGSSNVPSFGTYPYVGLLDDMGIDDTAMDGTIVPTLPFTCK